MSPVWSKVAHLHVLHTKNTNLHISISKDTTHMGISEYVKINLQKGHNGTFLRAVQYLSSLYAPLRLPDIISALLGSLTAAATASDVSSSAAATNFLLLR